MAHRKLRRGDLWLAGGLVLVCLCLVAGSFCFRRAGAVAVVTLDGAEYCRLDLSEDRELRVELPGGEYNVIVVRDGAVWVSEASCPDRVCARTPAARYVHQSVVCLPHRLVITVVSGSRDVDLVSGVPGAEGGAK